MNIFSFMKLDLKIDDTKFSTFKQKINICKVLSSNLVVLEFFLD